MATPNTGVLPIFSDSLRKLLEKIECEAAVPIKKILNLKDLSEMIDCGCAECLRDAEEERPRLTIWNAGCGMNYFSYREKEGMISYMPAGKEQEVGSDGAWLRKCRQEITPARWLKKILSEKGLEGLKDDKIATFSKKFLAKEQEEKISIIEIDVQTAYNSPVASCMRGKPVFPFYGLFGARAVVARQFGAIVGRAVLWPKLEGQEIEAPLMDRIYPPEGPITEALKDHAKSMGWWWKKSQGAASSSVMHATKEGVQSCVDWTVKRVNPGVANNIVSYWPYMDTFARSDKLVDTLYFSSKETPGGWIYTHQGGSRERDTSGMIQCAGTSEWYEKIECVNYDGYWYHTGYMVECAYSKLTIPKNIAFKIMPPNAPAYYVHRKFCNKAIS